MLKSIKFQQIYQVFLNWNTQAYSSKKIKYKTECLGFQFMVIWELSTVELGDKELFGHPKIVP